MDRLDGPKLRISRAGLQWRGDLLVGDLVVAHERFRPCQMGHGQTFRNRSAGVLAVLAVLQLSVVPGVVFGSVFVEVASGHSFIYIYIYILFLQP